MTLTHPHASRQLKLPRRRCICPAASARHTSCGEVETVAKGSTHPTNPHPNPTPGFSLTNHVGVFSSRVCFILRFQRQAKRKPLFYSLLFLGGSSRKQIHPAFPFPLETNPEGLSFASKKTTSKCGTKKKRKQIPARPLRAL